MRVEQVSKGPVHGRHRASVETHVHLTDKEALEQGLCLINIKSAATLVNRSQPMIAYWTRRGYLRKYFVFGNSYNYVVDLNEVLEQASLSDERKRNPHPRTYYSKKNRHQDGRFKK